MTSWPWIVIGLALAAGPACASGASLKLVQQARPNPFAGRHTLELGPIEADGADAREVRECFRAALRGGRVALVNEPRDLVLTAVVATEVLDEDTNGDTSFAGFARVTLSEGGAPRDVLRVRASLERERSIGAQIFRGAIEGAPYCEIGEDLGEAVRDYLDTRTAGPPP